MSIAILHPLPTPPPALLALPLPYKSARVRRDLYTTDGLVSVTAAAWGLTGRQLS